MNAEIYPGVADHRSEFAKRVDIAIRYNAGEVYVFWLQLDVGYSKGMSLENGYRDILGTRLYP